MGSGQWYGVPNYGEYVMVYYNKDMFAEYGVEVPTTFEDWEAAMQTFVDVGITPLSLGATEYPAQHILYQLALSQADRDWVDAYELYKGDVDFHDEAFTYAAETMVEWVERGYIAEDATGLAAEDVGVAFINGEYPMMVSGSWWYGRFMNEIESFEWSTFLWPGTELHAGSGGNLWVVPTNAKNKELAYEFIDITMSPEIQSILGNEGGIPVAADLAQIDDPMGASSSATSTRSSRRTGSRSTPTGPPLATTTSWFPACRS